MQTNILLRQEFTEVILLGFKTNDSFLALATKSI